jgi:hypothetical protein
MIPIHITILIIIFIIVVMCICTSQRNFKNKLYSNLPRHKIQERVKCLDGNGRPTKPSVDEDGDVICDYYYNTTSADFEIPVNKASSSHILETADPFKECLDLGENCQIGKFYGTDPRALNLVYSQYSNGQEVNGIISGYRVDNPMKSDSAIYLIFEDLAGIGHGSSVIRYNDIENLEECQNVCSREYDVDATGRTVQGGYLFKYDTNGKNCDVVYSHANFAVPSFIKSPSNI